MATINQVKQSPVSDTPLLLFQCVLPSGNVQYWSTHSVEFSGQQYLARVLKHNLFDLQLSADDAMDGISKLSLTLANADSRLSELNNVIGFKGSQLAVYFTFADLPSGAITTESTILFKGLAGDPDEITEESLRLTFTNKLSLQRIALPDVRIQRLCSWNFPSTPDQRAEAVNGGVLGKYSRFYRCGYSADVTGGVGNVSNGAAFTACDHSRANCEARGMFDIDATGHVTRRHGGFEFVPSSTLVRTNGAKTYHTSAVIDTSARYNDPVPMVYGTGWLDAPVILSRNDGNLTHMEVLLGMGPLQSILNNTIQGVFKVVVNDVEIPQGIAGQDMTTTGWYNIVSTGAVAGAFNPDFTDENQEPLGDPYGSMAVLSIIVPNRISSGRTAPQVQVLLDGMLLDTFDLNGNFQATVFTKNPAWVILDILRRCGWPVTELNIASFAKAAAFCQEVVHTTDLNGNQIQVPRFQCNLILTKRKSAAEIVRGIRVASSLMLRYGSDGLLELVPEAAIAEQQPNQIDGSNSIATLNGGWPAYEFSDGSGSFSGIVRNPNGTSTVRLTSRGISETSNRLSVEFQDESNEYQQDSLSVVHAGDTALIGYEIASQSTALGIANYSQAYRVLLRQLDKSVNGNQFIEFQTSFRALKVRPGDIITVTYTKEYLARTPFRVVKLSPSMNYEIVTILAQVHNDDWYSNNPAALSAAGRQQGSQTQIPRPLLGVTFDSQGNTEFGVQESIQGQSDGTATDILTVSFVQPTKPASSLNLPLVGLEPQIADTGGALAGNTNYYYAVSSVDSNDREGPLSFTVRAWVSEGPATNSVTISNLSFPSKATKFHVYRGTTPQMLYRIKTGLPIATTHTDTGEAPQPIGPPDASFDHANFYYRFEVAGPFLTSGATRTSIRNDDMGAVNSAYSSMLVRIIDGKGQGQERQITTNDQTTLTVTPPWSVTPDATSRFVITETSWRFGAVSSVSPLQFEVPYQVGIVIQISGRGANVNNQEGDAALCPITRWTLGSVPADSDVPVAPDFSLSAPGQGDLTLFQVGFQDLKNTASISTGTLQTIYWNELQTPSDYSLAADLNESATILTLNQSGSASLGDVIQVGTELMTVRSESTNTYTVVRGDLGSSASAHAAGNPVLHLQSSIFVVPFARGFFENRASLNFLHTVELPSARIAAAQFFVTNACGNSPTTTHAYTTGPDAGLRTLSGGQFSIQVSGNLAVQENAAPPLLVEKDYAVRDIRATVSEAPGDTAIKLSLLQNGAHYCDLTILPGQTISGQPAGQPLNGVDLPPLLEGATLSLNITQVGQAWQSNPGRDLTVTIRL